MRMRYGGIGLRVKALLGIVLPLAALFLVLAATGQHSLGALGLGLATVSVLVFIGINQTFVVPLGRLRREIAGVDEGRFTTPPAPRRRDDFGQLADSITAMRDRLRQRSLDLEQKIEELTLDGARLFEDLQASYLGTVRALSAAIDAKDPYTRGHSGRVVKYCQMIAAGLGYSESETEVIKIAAYLHDIGKIGIDEQILLKPYKLNTHEYDLVKRHASISAKILTRVAFLQRMIPIVRHHHEHYDGRGYPHGLSGEDIPIGARIICVADSFDAMISDRPYRPALSTRQAFDELRRCSGSQFDPQIVDIFIEHAAAIADEPARPAPHHSVRY